jgi:hypothetical protein
MAMKWWSQWSTVAAVLELRGRGEMGGEGAVSGSGGNLLYRSGEVVRRDGGQWVNEEVTTVVNSGVTGRGGGRMAELRRGIEGRVDRWSAHHGVGRRRRSAGFGRKKGSPPVWARWATWVAQADWLAGPTGPKARKQFFQN